MVSQFVSLLDSIVTWIERVQRTPWGGKMVALAATLAIAVAQWAYGLPIVLIVPLAIITFAALVFLLLALPPLISRVRPFPFAVSVPMVCETEVVRDRGLEFYAEMTPSELRILERLRQRPHVLQGVLHLLQMMPTEVPERQPSPKRGRPIAARSK